MSDQAAELTEVMSGLAKAIAAQTGESVEAVEHDYKQSNFFDFPDEGNEVVEEKDDSEEVADDEEAGEGEAEDDTEESEAGGEEEEVEADGPVSREIYNQLLEQVNRVAKEKMGGLDTATAIFEGSLTKPVVTKKEPVREEQYEAVGLELPEISEDRFEEIFSNKENFSKFLGQFGETVRDGILRSVLPLAYTAVSRKISLHNMVQDFYSRNPDLAQFKEYVGLKATTIQQENPDFDDTKILEETASRVRKELNLPEVKRRAEAVTKKMKPAFARAKGGPVKGKKRSNSVLDEFKLMQNV